MTFLKDFLSDVFPNSQLVEAEENDQIFRTQFVSSEYNSKNSAELQTYFNFLSDRDNLHLSIVFGNADAIVFQSERADFDTLCKSLEDESLYLEDGESITIDIIINKLVRDTVCSIYDIDTFVKTIGQVDANQFFSIFSRLLTSDRCVNFKVFNLDFTFYSSSISFSSLESDFKLLGHTRRDEQFEAFVAHCHFTNIENFRLLPSDFKLLDPSKVRRDLNEIFERYLNLLSIISLFDITSVKGDVVEFKINGYKSIKGIAKISELVGNGYAEYHEIFEWVYTGGNLSDKIGLARNIISLHFIENGKLKLQGHPFQSVKSSYKVYERQNIKQYIEIRNKIADQLIDFNNRANKVIETFASGFQKSALALVTFYFSAIAIKVLGSGNFVNVFTFDMTILSVSFLAGSFIYFLVARWEVKEQRKRFIASYENLKVRYTDLLEKEDIQRILINDKDFNGDVKFINDKLKNYTKLWLSFLGILLLATLFLFAIYHFSKLNTLFIWGALFSNMCI
ncbi:hypothetical protein [Niabella beijingensis]|uniref:hypothetical protein n=1 Tax=Niabella beijingensis TaxID=2872700 RepID=UPI001CBBD8B3|nr:hypothetical protein [Niabella beijingensis]MBZ4191721.1 hypothetical protein [Niabella beijingensis]